MNYDKSGEAIINQLYSYVFFISLILFAAIMVILKLFSRKKAGRIPGSNMRSQKGESISVSDLPPFPGMEIQIYRIVQELDNRGMAINYLAKDAHGNQYLVKVPQTQNLKNDDYMARFHREAEILHKLNHPNILHLLKSGVLKAGDRELPFMIMEYVEGKDLGKIMREECPLDINKAAHIVKGILKAIDVVHREDVVHRNIKPTSIRVREDGEVILLNFGIAKLLGAQTITQAGTAMGTALYMAPEQMTDDKIDKRADLYALGVIFYKLVTGTFPYDAKNVPDLMPMKMNQDPEEPYAVEASIPREISDIVMKLLKRERAERYQSAEAVLEDIERVMDEIDRKRSAMAAMNAGNNGAEEPEKINEGVTERKEGRLENLENKTKGDDMSI